MPATATLAFVMPATATLAFVMPATAALAAVSRSSARFAGAPASRYRAGTSEATTVPFSDLGTGDTVLAAGLMFED